MAWRGRRALHTDPGTPSGESETWPRRHLSPQARTLLISLLVGIAVAAACALPWTVSWQENFDLYLLFHARGKRPTPGNVVIVPVDRRAAEAIWVSKNPHARATCEDVRIAGDHTTTHEKLDPPHLMSRWPRCLTAKVVESLHAAGASAIVLDVMFRNLPASPDRDSDQAAEGDRQLAQAMRLAGNVLIAQRIEGEHDQPAETVEAIAEAAIGQAPFLLPRTNLTFVHRFSTLEVNAWDNVSMPVLALQVHTLALYNVLHDILTREAPDLAMQLPSTIREVQAQRHLQSLALMLRMAFQKDSSLSRRVVDALGRPEHADLTPIQRAQLTALVRAYSGSSSRYFNLKGPPGTIQAVRFERLVSGKDLPDLSGKVVFLGLAEYGQPEQYEHFATIWQDLNGFDHSGVELAATALSNLLDDDSIEPVPLWLGLLLTFALTASLAWLCFLSTTSRALLVTLAMLCFYFAFALLLFEYRALWLPVGSVAVGSLFALGVAFGTQYVDLKHQYRGLYKVLGMFVPRTVVERLVNNAERLAWIRETAFGACVATDGERYTALADRLSPVELSRFLNRYFQTLFPPVASSEGWVSDVVGDSMLAVWAESRPNPRVRERACQAALEMLAASERFNDGSESAKMATRIGVDFGPIALTTLGAGTHWEYRPVGAVPNTANRLQSLNKRLGTKLLVSDAVLGGLDGFLARDLGWFLLRGKGMPTRVFELMSERDLATSAQLRLCEQFGQALDRFQAGDLERAAALFAALAQQHPDDGPCAFFAALCRQETAHVGGVVVVNE